MADNWNIYRIGKAASATTATGQIPQYGLAMDLGTAQWQNADQFNSAVRDFAAKRARQEIMQSQDVLTALANERSFAETFQKVGGASLTPDQYDTIVKASKDPSWLDVAKGNASPWDAAKAAPDMVMGGLDILKGGLRSGLSEFLHNPKPGFQVDNGGSGPAYADYKKAGGLLSQNEFESYDPDTQQFLLDHAEAVNNIGDVIDSPGIKHLLAGISLGYRAVQTPFIVAGDGNKYNPGRFLGLDPNWYDGSEWAKAWRESQDESLGNAIVNSIIQPYAGQDRVDEWRKNSSIYQLTSLGTELGAGWYLDAGVLAGKGVGAATRLSRGEMPLRETSGIYKATRQALQREEITVRNPVTAKLGEIRAGQINSQWDKVKDYALNRPYHEFADLPMFRKRDLNGQSAAYALYHAFRESPGEAGQGMLKLVPDEQRTYDSLEELTKQLMMGDPKAYEQLAVMRQATPEELKKFAPNAQSYIEAIDATKTKIDSLQKEADDLEKQQTFSPFHEWSVHTEVEQRYKDILDATDQLNKYEGYSDWLQNASREPELNRVHARHFFLDNPYGRPHVIQKWTQGLWLQKANVMPMHDVDLGAESIRRQFQQADHLWGYHNPDALSKALDKWHRAETNFDRYQVAQDVEEHLIASSAEHFGADPEVIFAIYQKVIDEQNKVFDGIMRGNQSVYSTAPDLASRIRAGQNVSLVSHNPDTQMVDLELMDGGRRVTTRVHESALSPKVRPVDPTQTPNYYQPIDARRFYLELKRNEEIVKDWSRARAAGAALADFTDAVGTRFNMMWKPLQLFRFGWPQRVLMDENARALAILGIPAFTRYYGEAYGKAAANVGTAPLRKALNYYEKKSMNGFGDLVDWSISNPRIARKYGRDRAPMGPGPVVDSVTREADPVEHDAELAAAPRVPESWTPQVDKKRLAAVNGHVAVFEDFQHQIAKQEAWQRRFEEDASRRAEMYANGKVPTGPTPAGGTPIQQRAYQEGLRAAHATIRRPWHPLPRMLTHADNAARHKGLGEMMHDGPYVYDPITAKQVKSGHIVPLPHTRTPIPDDWDLNRIGTGLEDWYAKHRELLGSRGYRVVINPDMSISVGRLFGARERRRAQAFQQFVEGDMWHLPSGTRYVTKDVNDLSPTTEAAYRQFVASRDIVKTEGETPYGGPKRLEHGQVYHGSYSGLPTNEAGDIEMVTRDQAPVASGRMVGEGFYTTTSEDMASGYGYNLYTLKGAKDGKTYKVFDLEKVPSKAELNRFRKWLRDNRDAIQQQQFYTPWQTEHPADIVGRYIDAMEAEQRPTWWYSASRSEGENTWLDLMANLEDHGQLAQGVLTRYLEEVHGAGALHHIGGRITGNDTHHVYVWLHPEELLVKPAYAPSENYTPFVKWLDHPLSKEVPIPENRIVRTGVRNPVIREMRTYHAQLKDLQKRPHSWFEDPEHQAEYERVLDNFSERAYALGVAAQMDGSLLMGDPGRWDRMMEEALKQDREHNLATAANGDLRAQEVGTVDLSHADLGDFDFQLDSVHGRVLRAVLKHREQGHGYVRVKSSDGKEVIVPSAYEGHDGELMRGLVSSQGAIEQLSDGHGAALSLFRRNAVGHRAFNPPAQQVLKKGTKEYDKAVTYFQKWADLLNTQIAHSPIWNKMLNGWSDERIVHWLDSTPEGAAVKREVMHEDRTTELWVNEHRAKLDYYLPSKKHQRLLAKGRVEPSTLRREIHPDERPSVFGPDVEFLDRRTGIGRMLSWMMDRMWHALGTAPIDAFSRHPFANSMYQLKMRSLVGQVKGEHLTQEVMDRFERQAREYARVQVRRHLWDLTDSTNFTDALRFIAPFWGAQQEAITKWLRIVADRPETVARAFNLQRAVYNNYMVVDQNGQPVNGIGYFNYRPNDRVIVRIPEVMRHTPLGVALQTIGTAGIPVGSANTVLQGDMPLLPGPGPLLTIPADKFLRATSDTYGTQWNQNAVYRWLFPVGRPQHGGIKGVMDQLLPGYGKRVMQAQDQDGVAYANLYTEVAREMDLEAQKNHKPAPTPEQIQHQAHFVWGLRVLTGMLAPVQVQYRPKHQFLIDAAHKYEKQYGSDWFDRFMQDYGESVARYAASSSNSPISLPPTSQGMEDWSQNQQLIEKYPQWGGAIISPDAYKGDFNSDAYYAQFGINLGPGDTTPLRQSMSTRERFAKADADAGWYEYRKVDAMLEAQLEQRGLHSINQTGAEDLLAMKKNFVADLSKRLPAWREQYDNYNNDIYARVNELEKWAFDKQFDNRPDIQGVRQYLVIRDQVAHELDRYAATTGGSRSLQSQENTNLRNWFYDQVGQLTQQNPAFAEFYSRYLGSDTLEQGSGQ